MSTPFKDNSITLAASLAYSNKWMTSEQMSKEFTWLRGIAVENIDRYLVEGIRLGYVTDRNGKNNTIEYRAKQTNKLMDAHASIK